MKRPIWAMCLARLIRASAWVFFLVAFIAIRTSTAAAQGLTINVGPDLGTYSMGPQEIQLFASGGTGTYTWSIAGGAPPPGLAIRSDKPTWFSPSASAGLSGVATTPG